MATRPVEHPGETRLGPYRLQGVLGEGGMGVVHLGIDGRGRAVAVKVLREHVAHDPVARARLAREVSTLRRVDHPRVAPFLGADVDGPRPYVVTRYVPGDALDVWIRRNGPLSGAALARFAAELAEALAAVHAAGVVHRDLKPGNVLMPGGSPVVIDFGIAHVADESRLTSTGLVMGTPGYLPPELLDGHDVSEATDVWGYSATVTFAATGRLPFGTGRVEAVLDRVRRGVVDLTGVAPGVEDALLAGLDPDPAERPSLRQLSRRLAAPTPGEAPTAGASPTVAVPTDTPLVTPDPVQDPGRSRRPAPAATEPFVPRPVESPAPAARETPPMGVPAQDGSTAVDGDRWGPGGRGGAHRSEAPTAAHPVVETKRMPVVRPSAEQEPTPPVQRPPAPPGPYAGFGGVAGGPAVPATPRSVPDPEPPRSFAPPPRPAAETHGATPALPPVDARRRSGTLLALGFFFVALTGYLPGVGVLVLLGWSWLVRLVERVESSVILKRAGRGPRDRDVPLAVLSSPLHLVGAGFSALVCAIIPALVGPAFVLGLRALGRDWGIIPVGLASAIMVGATAAVIVSWWGPGGWSLRHGSRTVVRVLAPGRAGAIAATVVFGVVGVVLALMTQSSGWRPDYWPFDELPSLVSGLVGARWP